MGYESVQVLIHRLRLAPRGWGNSSILGRVVIKAGLCQPDNVIQELAWCECGPGHLWELEILRQEKFGDQRQAMQKDLVMA